ncbi:efflux RND transporter permease subunit [Actimicrobium sp. CCC2.4]|nr:efflux RND transporter permease subunit [Actimicrobium sp. CCC2.4]WPX30846.1 efflux RND transporter permease subunit [Actimicrobium sp. CCC2.4]
MMLARLITFSLAQRLLVLVLTLVMIGAGIQAFRNLPIDAFPDVSSTQVKLILKAPGMTPEEVEMRMKSYRTSRRWRHAGRGANAQQDHQ